MARKLFGYLYAFSGLFPSVFGYDDSPASLNIPTLKFTIDEIELAEDSFWEDFQSYTTKASLSRSWITSEFLVEDPSSLESRKQYKGEWGIEEPRNLKALEGDKALSSKTSGVAAMIGHILSNPIEFNDNSSLVVQYEVQLQNDLKCGGAFLKLLPNMQSSQLRNYGGSSPVLELLFGPDMCPPYTDEIHLGIKKTNPITMRPELKLLQQAPLSSLNDTSIAHLYTLILKGATSEYEIRLDGSVVKAGYLLEKNEFLPGFSPPESVPDPKEQKPIDWDDRKFIPDPELEKPDDWDDSEPLMIVDDADFKPEDWDESIPELIPEPDRERPEWWVDTEYGEWIAPMIKNPACEKISGCGAWKPRLVDNPKYKGPWNPPMVENPGYQGEWHAKLIKNPDYYEDSAPSKLENPVGAVIFEFWSGTNDLLIDNLYIGKHIEEAEELGNKTFVPKRKIQDKQNELKHANHSKTPPSANDYPLHDSPNFYDRLVDKAAQHITATFSSISQLLGVNLLTVILGGLALLIGVLDLRKRTTGQDSKTEEEVTEPDKEKVREDSSK